ncbi:MAG: DegT/DnrJ/EryC1/StrS family aminotransferase [Verrucomicrobia bacterium]|nr:DegT/DnrJ/EryC1/StrS family aminotransferase [Verrucomicrobiota bacterium]
MNSSLTRRGFIRCAAAGSAALSWLGARRAPAAHAAEADKPALLGGTPVHSGGWPAWPMWRESWEPAILDVLRSRRWFRNSGKTVTDFEAAYAQLLGTKRCLATSSGTTALLVGMHVLGVDAGDEVITSPYTFIATYNAILMTKALPVFADTDPATLTMDPASIASRITDRTRVILPVHIYGLPCDMDPINAIARQHRLPVLEDACQAWLAEYKGRKCGALGDLGTFSFQESKHLPSGEGGAITGNSDELLDRCHAYHNCGRAHGTFKGSRTYFTRGGNYRMLQYQAAILLQQIEKLVTDTARRRENADYLSARLGQIPGIQPVRLPENTRPVWHLYPFRYDAAQFNGLSRDRFIRALGAEGIPASSVYHEQYFDGLLDEAIASRGFKRLWSAERLKAYRDSLHDLRGNRETCATTVAVFQNTLLAERPAIQHIVDGVAKVHAHSAALAKAAA